MYDIILLNRNKLDICFKFAKNCSIGGKSQIRGSDDRKKNLLFDNFIGQLGTLAGCIFLLGEAKGMEEYTKAREQADKNPFVGDGGKDLLDYNLDIKCSYMRNSQNPETYNFLIRPRERHKDWVYLQTLAQKNSNKEFIVHIAGWLSDNDLPEFPESSGIFAGAYRMSVTKMKKFPILFKN
jgi:hypothetical protein